MHLCKVSKFKEVILALLFFSVPSVNTMQSNYINLASSDYFRSSVTSSLHRAMNIVVPHLKKADTRSLPEQIISDIYVCLTYPMCLAVGLY